MSGKDPLTGKIRGTKLSYDEFHNGLHVKHAPEIAYEWATGVAISKFLKGLKKGKIIGARCDDCDRTVVPPRMFCEECFAPMVEYVKLPDTGIVNTFSIAYIKTDASRVDKPQLPAVIDIDGTTISPSGFLHLLDEVKPEDIKVGMKVKAVWKDKEERTGDITDIKYFKPMEDA
ncbi:MAG: Zn-ribbon domain-containing OB-fold protein [Candidatus Heimdallarchaeota archaeon]|nr:Zn-ribbon domain-containing OB-fold protein [Candidatus Heimdallarchaeota archaeon]